MSDRPEHETGAPKPGRARLEEMDARLGTLRDAVSGSLRDIADQFQAAFGTHVRTGGFGMEHEVRTGTVLDEDGRVIVTPAPGTADETQEPEHELRQSSAAWRLECRLPGCGPLDLALSRRGGGLALRAKGYGLEVALPGDIDLAALSLQFEDGCLTLSAPRGGGPE